MSPETALLVAAASGLFALLGSLGSQIISAFANIRAKRMELVYSRKVDTYKEFIQKSVSFCDDAENEEKYLQFYNALLATVTVASDDVFKALAHAEMGPLQQAHKLRESSDEDEKVQYLQLYQKSIDHIALTMRRDLKKFVGK